MFDSKKKPVSDGDFATLYDCMNGVRRAAKHDEFALFKKNALKIDGVLSGTGRKNYATVVGKLILYGRKWEVCFTGSLREDLVKASLDAALDSDNSSPLTLGRDLVEAIRGSDANRCDLYGRFLGAMAAIANSALPATVGNRTAVIDGNRIGAAGRGSPRCSMDVEAFASDGQYAIPVWNSGLPARVYGLAVCEL